MAADIAAIKTTMRDILLKLARIESFGSGEVPNNLDNGLMMVELPLKNEDELSMAELELSDHHSFTHLVMHLSSFGGDTPQKAISNIMKNIFSTNLAVNYNWAGKPPKKAFRELKLSKAVLSAFKKMQKFPINQAFAEDCIKNWLKQAPQRLKKL